MKVINRLSMMTETQVVVALLTLEQRHPTMDIDSLTFKRYLALNSRLRYLKKKRMSGENQIAKFNRRYKR